MTTPTRMLSDVDPEQKARDLETILDVTRKMSSVHDTDELLGIILSETVRVMNADRASLFLVDKRTNELVARIAQKAATMIRFPVGRGIAGHVAATKEIVNIPDAYNDARFNPEFDRKTGYVTRTILCAPLLTKENDVIGVMQVINKKDGAFTRYDESFLLAFGSQCAIALENARLLKDYIEQQKTKQALSIARNVQQGLLPKESPDMPGWDVGWKSIPCDATGGDYFDFVPLPDGRMGLAIGDVSGHGMGPALLMASARSFLRALSRQTSNPSSVLPTLNDLVSRDMEAERFITLFYGALDPATGAMKYASAGHDAPLLLRAAAGTCEELDSTGVPLGILPGSDFPSADVPPMGKGDILVLSTDGVWEAMNPATESYGRDRLRAILDATKAQGAQAIVDAVYEDVLRFCDGAAQRDDFTLVIVKRKE
ncbi:MAG: SpoIIE family protein phosphatase [Planctomycetia bacterium]|nr:SpoIIE family protein phosphatase [Planctomycetia bacterium]